MSSRMRDQEGRTIDFGRSAADYAHYRPGFPDSFFDRVMDAGWASAGMRALDLGTGTGSLALGFAERGLTTVGIDISPQLLDVARQRAAGAAFSATFVEGQAETTGCDADSFELVTAGQCWWWFDGATAAQEALRVLRPGGRLLVATFSYLALPGTVAHRTEELVLRHNPGWPKAGWRGVHPEQVQDLDVAGFRSVESFSYVEDVLFSHEAWRGRMRTCNGVGSALDNDTVTSFDRDLATMLEDEYEERLTVPHRVFVVTGVKSQ